LRALIAAAARQLSWGLPATARQVHHWRHLAQTIPDTPIRDDALDALARKRAQTDGAALFAILPQAANPNLLQALVTYQIIWDFLDSVGERYPALHNSRQLNQALIDALEPAGAHHDYYRHHPWHNDGGYLHALVTVSQEATSRLPAYPSVERLVLREAHRADVLALNHDPNHRRKATSLRSWANREFPSRQDATWWELTGAASAGLTIFALLALAAEPTSSQANIRDTANAYFPWPGALATMLDSYVDQHEDVASDAHIYIRYYKTHETAITRIGELVRRSLHGASQLPAAPKHRIIIASMVAMYLSKDSARTLQLRHATVQIAQQGGSLTTALLPILRLWRIAYHLQTR
jgi:tetraprenyl-beta-curcumene synthase